MGTQWCKEGKLGHRARSLQPSATAVGHVCQMTANHYLLPFTLLIGRN